MTCHAGRGRAMFKVFIGSTTEAKAYAAVIADALESTRFYSVLRWWEVFRPNQSVYTQILSLVDEVDFALFVTTPDDSITTRDREIRTVRANVILEYGMFTGRLGHTNTVRVHVGPITNGPSDLYGVHDLHADVAYEPGHVPLSDDVPTLAETGRRAGNLFLGACAEKGHNPLASINGLSADTEDLSIAAKRVTQTVQRAAFTKAAARAPGYAMARDILEQGTDHHDHRVGLDGTLTTTRAFVDFDRLWIGVEKGPR